MRSCGRVRRVDDVCGSHARCAVSTAASNLDANYGITAKIDEQLKLSAAVEKVTDKIDEVKTSVSSKVDDLKTKASSS
jgi:hypothetical protein